MNSKVGVLHIFSFLVDVTGVRAVPRYGVDLTKNGAYKSFYCHLPGRCEPRLTL